MKSQIQMILQNVSSLDIPVTGIKLSFSDEPHNFSKAAPATGSIIPEQKTFLS